jgi:hypothetical protein
MDYSCSPSRYSLYGYGGQSHYLLTVQQAYLVREQVRQTRIETRRLLLEQARQERLYRMSPEYQEYLHWSRVQPELNNPPDTRILSGYSLNVLLDEIQRRHTLGECGPDVPVDPEVLRQLNLGVQGTEGPAHLGAMEAGAELAWPMPLRDPRYDSARTAFESAFRIAEQEARFSQAVTYETLQDLERRMGQLRGIRDAAVREVALADSIEVKAYLDRLGETVAALSRPALVRQLAAHAAGPPAGTVAELIEHLGTTGFRFGPAMPGDEAAYHAAHTALAAYLTALTNG